jgi:regulator of protease activity HflC (stomatin/prohibitin superfamily)
MLEVTQLYLQLGIGESIGIAIVVIIMLILLASAIRIIREYERAVVFRLGRLIGAKGPGLIILVPVIDKAVKVDLRVMTLDVTKQKIITLDNVTVDVDAVVYMRVNEPTNAIVRVENFRMASSMLAQTTLRDVIGQVDFDDILSKRDELNKRIQEILDAATDPWGIKVTAVAIKDVSLPENMHRAIAKQAEAEREKRGRIIIAEGELKAAEKMAQAAEFYTKNIAAMRLRELQTWAEIAREKNMIVVTGGDSSNIGPLLGILKQGGSESHQIGEDEMRVMIRQEIISLLQGRRGEEAERAGKEQKQGQKERKEERERES